VREGVIGPRGLMMTDEQKQKFEAMANQARERHGKGGGDHDHD